jgi:uncharacterized delta-60 repeat protein
MRNLIGALANVVFSTVVLSQSGALDLSFDPGAGADDYILSTAVQADGKVLIGGEFESVGGVPRSHIARLNTDGSLDTTFDPGSGTGNNTSVYDLVIQPDGKIIIVGIFSFYNGVPRKSIARLNTDGSLDTSFDPGTGADFDIRAASIRPNGMILIGGTFSAYDGTPMNRTARINANGTLDTTFDPGTGANDAVLALVVQPDGKVLIGGEFTAVNGIARNHFARLNADGTVDTSFDTGDGVNGYVQAMALRSDGRGLIGGSFYEYDGTPTLRVARFNADGTLDPSFDTSMGASSQVRSVAVQGDGRIIISGYFTSYGGTSTGRIARLNTDGTLDLSFDPGTAANNTVFSCALGTDGKVVLAGDFTAVDGTTRNRVARLNGLSVGVIERDLDDALILYPNPSSGELRVDLGAVLHGVSVEVINSMGQVIHRAFEGSTDRLQLNIDAGPGMYAVVITTADGRSSSVNALID